MGIDELRNEIWDLIYRSGNAMSIADIAQQLNCDQDQVRSAVEHEWFQVSDDTVTVAY